MLHGGDIYRNKVNMDYSVSLNPLGPPPGVMRALRDSVSRVTAYPDPEQEAVRKAIAEREHVPPEWIAAGGGASQLILAAARAINPKTAVLFEPAYPGYAHALRSVGCRIIRKVLREEDGFALTEKSLSVLDERPDLVFICDPANPSGLCVREDVLTELLDRTKRTGMRVILDESFLLMSVKADGRMDGICAERIRSYSHLYIIRSLTKVLAMPGIRMGYVISSPDNIAGLERQLPEWDLSVPAEAAIRAGMEVLGEPEYLRKTYEVAAEEREFLAGKMREMGFSVFRSDAPYLLFRGPETLCDDLLRAGILIRDCSSFPGLGRGYFRIGIRDHGSNEKLCRALREILRFRGDIPDEAQRGPDHEH